MSAGRSRGPRGLAGDVIFRCLILAGCLAGAAVMAILGAKARSGPEEFGSLQVWFVLSDAVAFFVIFGIFERVAAARRRELGKREPERVCTIALSVAQIAAFVVPLVVIRGLLGPG